MSPSLTLILAYQKLREMETPAFSTVTKFLESSNSRDGGNQAKH